MATTGAINGKNLGLWINGSLVALAKSSDISISHAVRDTTSKDSDWNTNGTGGLSWTAKTDNLVSFDATFGYDEIMDLMLNRTEVGVSVETNVSGDTRLYGSARITSVETSAPNQETATYSVSLEGNGTLTKAAHT